MNGESKRYCAAPAAQPTPENPNFDSDVPDEEGEAMLEGALPAKFKRKYGKEGKNEEQEKVVRKEIGHSHFDMLPEGWIQVTHESGMPIYLHKQSSVCTVTKPYFLGPNSARKHEIPLSAIQRLQDWRVLDAPAQSLTHMEVMQKEPETDLTFFDSIKIKDPEVSKLCEMTKTPSPYEILHTCLQRKYSLKVNCNVSLLRHQTYEVTMTVGSRVAKVICSDINHGIQLASQTILKILHPYKVSWGLLLRLYGSRPPK